LEAVEGLDLSDFYDVYRRDGMGRPLKLRESGIATNLQSRPRSCRASIVDAT